MLTRIVNKFLSSLILLASCNLSFAVGWQSLTPGIQYLESQTEATQKAHLHLFKIDLSKYQLDLAFAQDNDAKRASIRQLTQKNQALIGINGGFFSPESTPLGLRIQNGQQRFPLKNTSWWGIFSVTGSKASITAKKNYDPKKEVGFAIQAGPRLIVDGRIPSLKPGFAERSALCITRDGDIIIAATQNTPVSTTEFAQILNNSNLMAGSACHNALNLDGGSSTQLFAQMGDFRLSIPSFALITDAVIVKAKEE